MVSNIKGASDRYATGQRKGVVVRKNNKKEAILAAAQEVFAEKGLRDATITEIANPSGMYSLSSR